MHLSFAGAIRQRIDHWNSTKPGVWPLVAVFGLHLAAIVVMFVTETRWVPWLAFMLSWIFWNAIWVVLLRRPIVAAALSLLFLAVLILLSQFKHEILLMTVNAVDLVLVDRDTFLFLMQVIPKLGLTTALGVVIAVAAMLGLWRLDTMRIGRRMAAATAAITAMALTALCALVPSDPWEEFYAENYFSKYMRSAFTAANELATRGVFDKAAKVEIRLAPVPTAPCTVEKPPHIVFVHDESSFDARVLPGVKVPAGYGDYFASFDGRARNLFVEGPGGPSWYTEYNVVTGLSARSFGRFVDFATRIAVGRVQRGLPQALSRCGYHTHTLYPIYGSFLSAERFQKTAGTETFLDSRDLGAKFLDTDGFFFNKAADLIRDRKGDRPLFLHVYTAQNHFPWSFRFRPDLAPNWKDPGNRADVDEYLRRQHLTETDYRAFLARLTRDFPTEAFLIVRFGDHQPYFARHLIDPKQDDSMLVRRIAAGDPRFLKTYYAIDTIRFTPRDLTAARDDLDAAYLPLVVLGAAGVPLDPSFEEQLRILARCNGLFQRCKGGEEARRFNRLLIDAGLIKGL